MLRKCGLAFTIRVRWCVVALGAVLGFAAGAGGRGAGGVRGVVSGSMAGLGARRVDVRDGGGAIFDVRGAGSRGGQLLMYNYVGGEYRCDGEVNRSCGAAGWRRGRSSRAVFAVATVVVVWIVDAWDGWEL